MFNRRKLLLMGAAATMLAGCTGQSTTTIQGIVDWLISNCKFTTSANAVAQVLATIVSGFNAAAGAAAVVAIGIAQQVETAICNAVNQQVAQIMAEGKKLETAPAGHNLVVVVNGVQVPGTYAG